MRKASVSDVNCYCKTKSAMALDGISRLKLEESLSNNSLFLSQFYEHKSLALHSPDFIVRAVAES